MRCERIAGLGRILANLNKDASETYAQQWLERTLDDRSVCPGHLELFIPSFLKPLSIRICSEYSSVRPVAPYYYHLFLETRMLISYLSSAPRRIYIPSMFLCADAICMTLDNVVSGLVIYPNVIHSHLMAELPFMATENIIMKLVSLGISRQYAHEEIRVLSHLASDVVKKEGGKNDLIERIRSTEFFKPVWGALDDLLDPAHFIGRCPEQVSRFCGEGGEVQAALRPYKKFFEGSKEVELSV